MTSPFTGYITEEERLAAEERGREEGIGEGLARGISVAREIIRLLKEGVSTGEIAKSLKVPENQVNEFFLAL